MGKPETASTVLPADPYQELAPHLAPGARVAICKVTRVSDLREISLTQTLGPMVVSL